MVISLHELNDILLSLLGLDQIGETPGHSLY
jgi:hypothetical protein